MTPTPAGGHAGSSHPCVSGRTFLPCPLTGGAAPAGQAPAARVHMMRVYRADDCTMREQSRHASEARSLQILSVNTDPLVSQATKRVTERYRRARFLW